MLSYSAITNRGKVTLPSAESWGTNLNILKDPPKSIHTRYKSTVGSNNDLLDEVGDSGNRIGEYINVYARGVNPSVSVSYSNTGSSNNGSITAGGQTHAKLPYRIMRDGAFRPPILTQEDLLPVSRLPRVRTEAKTNAINIDYTKKVFDQEQQEKGRQIKENVLHTFIRPTAVYKIDKPQEKTYDVKFSIKEVIKSGGVSAGYGCKNIVQNEVKVPTAEINTDNLHAHARCNIGDTRKFINNNEVYTEKYIQDTNVHSVQINPGTNQNYVAFDSDNFDTDRYIQDIHVIDAKTNPTSNKHYTLIDEVADLSDLPVKQKTIVVSTNAPVSKREKINYIHSDIQLERNMPEHSAVSNKTENIYKKIEPTNQIELERNTPVTSFVSNIVGKSAVDNNSKEARLAPKIQAGSFDIPASIPKISRTDKQNIDSEKSRLNRAFNNDVNERFNMQPVGRR